MIDPDATVPLRIALLELPARFGESEAAFDEIERLLLAPEGSASGVDLALLPEASITGYVSPGGDFDLRRFAETTTGPTVERLSRLAEASRCAIAAPLIEREGEAFFNSFVVIDSSSRLLAHYRKRHPWYPETWATAGDRPMPSFVLRGLRLTLAICFDIHFIESESPDLLRESDVLLFPSAWVDDGEEDLRGPLFERIARRFDLVVANANWGRGEPRVTGQGSSRAVSPTGEMARAAEPRALGRRLDVEIVRG